MDENGSAASNVVENRTADTPNPNMDENGSAASNVVENRTADTPNPNVSTQPIPVSKRKRSIAWQHFTAIQPKSVNDKPMASCNYCGQTYACDSKCNGTKSMLTHIESQCKKYPGRGLDKRQPTLGFKPERESGGKLVALNFNLEDCRLALAEMIIMDELPFKFVENEGFKRLMHVVQPRWLKLPSRTTIAKDCFKVYLNEGKKLKLALKDQRVCLTTDTWTSLQNLNYMCLTAHYIDRDWQYHKKILNFCLVTSHKGEILGRAIELCLLEWGIDKFLTITVDNASSNNNVIDFIRRKTKNRKGIVLGHEFLHMRCCAHILNLVACEGLKEMDESILRVRTAVRYVRSSPSRMATFKQCAQKEDIKCKSQVCLDVATRWNSTYFMLERALQFQKAFERLEEEDNNYSMDFKDDEVDKDADNYVEIRKARKKSSTPPTSYDWEKVKLFVKFLKLFYDATLRFSGSLYVTSNASFMEIMLIQNAIIMLSKTSNIVLTSFAHGMQEKFDKYWGKFEKMNFMLFVSVILDPRYKLECVKFCFEQTQNEKEVNELMKKVRNGMTRVYDWYVRNDSSINVEDQNMSETIETNVVVDGEQDYRKLFVSQFKKHLEEENSMTSKSELDRYLADGCEDDSPSFDILGWWKVNSSKYRILSQVARDVLAIPVSTVASESAFSTGGRILDPFRSCLSPKTVEILICTQNWLRSTPINLRDAMDGIEQYECFESGVADSTSTDQVDAVI